MEENPESPHEWFTSGVRELPPDGDEYDRDQQVQRKFRILNN